MIQKITRKNLAKIYPKVCFTWQAKIKEELVKQMESDDIEVEDSILKEAYNQADSTQKRILEEYFDVNSQNKLFKKIKTYSDVCKELDEHEVTNKCFNLNLFEKSEIEFLVAVSKIKQIEKLFNGKWKKDWSDSSQYKWRPWFEYKKGHGWSFNGSDSYGSNAHAEVGFFETEEISNFVGKTFIDIFKVILD